MNLYFLIINIVSIIFISYLIYNESKSKYQDTTLNNSIKQSSTIEYFLLLVFILLYTYYLYNNNSVKVKKFKKIEFVLPIIIIIIFCCYIFIIEHTNPELKKKLHRATTHGIIALILAFMSHLNMIILPFWIIWICSYYLNIDV